MGKLESRIFFVKTVISVSVFLNAEQQMYTTNPVSSFQAEALTSNEWGNLHDYLTAISEALGVAHENIPAVN